MVLRSVLLSPRPSPVIRQNTAEHHAQMALTEDLTQKQHRFGECTLCFLLRMLEYSTNLIVFFASNILPNSSNFAQSTFSLRIAKRFITFAEI